MCAIEFNEQDLIASFAKRHRSQDPKVLCGIGDDAAVLKFHGKLLATSDALQEKIHFDWAYTSPFLLGRKSLSVNLSDIAAMGGKALWALVTLAIPHHEKLYRIEEFQKGLHQIAQEYGVQIVGGDTDHSRSGWKVSITILGEAGSPVYRHTARVGDDIWVTGFLGYSALGLECLRKKKSSMKDKRNPFIQTHLNPKPRLPEGLALSKNKIVHAMMDVSDGLILDLERMCEASQKGAEIRLQALPRSKRFLDLCKALKKSPETLMLSGGEDYELLFTASPQQGSKIQSLFAKLKTPVHHIGKITPHAKKIQILDAENKPISLRKKGYSHF